MIDLNSLLLDFEETEAEALADEGRRKYGELYTNKGSVGVHRVHDDEYCTFFLNRYYHAFFTTSDRNNPNLKDLLDVARLRRMKWIKVVMEQIADEWECWEVSGRSNSPDYVKRAYIAWNPGYIVWLEPKRTTGKSKWNFSTAYPAFSGYLRRQIRGGKRIGVIRKNDP